MDANLNNFPYWQTTSRKNSCDKSEFDRHALWTEKIVAKFTLIVKNLKLFAFSVRFQSAIFLVLLPKHNNYPWRSVSEEEREVKSVLKDLWIQKIAEAEVEQSCPMRKTMAILGQKNKVIA